MSAVTDPTFSVPNRDTDSKETRHYLNLDNNNPQGSSTSQQLLNIYYTGNGEEMNNIYNPDTEEESSLYIEPGPLRGQRVTLHNLFSKLEQLDSETVKRLIITALRKQSNDLLLELTALVDSEINSRVKENTFEGYADKGSWNERLMRSRRNGIICMTEEDIIEHCNVIKDFISSAETYAKIIVNEYALPISQKTIKPVDIGGHPIQVLS